MLVTAKVLVALYCENLCLSPSKVQWVLSVGIFVEIKSEADLLVQAINCKIISKV